jgi:hypothetical protein
MITIYACGYTIDNGKPTQRGACAASLEHYDSSNRKAVRVVSEPVGNSTGPQCDIKGAILGLMSINASPVLQFRKAPVNLYASKYVAQLLECGDDGRFKATPKKNAELVRRLREKVSLFENLTVYVGTKEQLQQPLDISKTAVNSGLHSDTGTLVLHTDTLVV